MPLQAHEALPDKEVQGLWKESGWKTSFWILSMSKIHNLIFQPHSFPEMRRNSPYEDLPPAETSLTPTLQRDKRDRMQSEPWLREPPPEARMLRFCQAW